MNDPKPSQGFQDEDWCRVDLSDELAEKAAKAARALGIDIQAFMRIALEEKIVRLREDEELHSAATGDSLKPMLTH